MRRAAEQGGLRFLTGHWQTGSACPSCIEGDPTHPNRIKVHAWATQAALSRPGRKKFTPRDVVDNIKFFTFDSDTLRWPKARIA